MNMISRPIPPPSRYKYSIKIDLDSLPEGVTISEIGEIGEIGSIRLFIANSSDKPLIINEIFNMDQLVAGSKLIADKVYQYYPSGVPMAGLSHLKGWQAPFGDISSTLFYLPKEPHKIYEGRKRYLSIDLPDPEPISIPINYDGQPHQIKVLIHYHLNDLYDKYYLDRDTDIVVSKNSTPPAT
jgi:hypothetical protein